MTHTLTTEQLKEIMCVYGNTHPCNLAAAECLANREAQPVGFYTTVSGRGGVVWHNGAPEDDTAIYTAPPAPAVPDGHCIMPLTLTAANGAKGALSGEFKVSRTVRCHECGGEGCNDCDDSGEFEEEITIPWDTIKEIYRAAVDACRAAMLAQPVSQGCQWIARGEQLPAIGETVLVSSDGYVSVGELERSGANYRYFTSVATGRELTVTHWMPLPAAPGGGNG